MLVVVTYWWHDARSKWRHHFDYTAEDVARVRSMVARNLSQPHRFVCVTDRPDALDGIDTLPLDRRLMVPGTRYPKLMTFRPDAAELFGGDRLLMLDLDIVVTASLDPLVDRPESFVAWKNPRFGRTGKTRRSRFNSSIVLVTAGAHPQIYSDFDPNASPAEMRARGYAVTDQGFMSERVGADAAGWSQADGVYSFRIELQRRALPDNARLVAFHGPVTPRMPGLRARHPWIGEHHR